MITENYTILIGVILYISRRVVQGKCVNSVRRGHVYLSCSNTLKVSLIGQRREIQWMTIA